MPVVHQLVPVLSTGDAIGAAVLRLQQLLRDAGYVSDVFAGLIDRRLRHHALPAAMLEPRLEPDDVLLYHLSIGSPLAADVRGAHVRRIVYYHNISPAEGAEPFSAVLAHNLRWGRADLAMLAPLADLCVAHSRYSLTDLRLAGARRTAVVSTPLDLARLRPRASTPELPLTLLFVGRFAPHKRQEELIRVIAALRALHCRDARLVLAGGAVLPTYLEALRRFADGLGVADGVDFRATPLSDRDLGDLYARAAVFLCASDHEGIGVPLLEAMAFALPILAYDAGAVAETVGAAGILVRDRDPLLWAELAWSLATDGSARQALAEAGRRRLRQLDDSTVQRELMTALALIGL